MNGKQRFRLNVKEISPEGVFEGWLSTYGNVDQGRDVVVPGAFAKTLAEQGNTRVMLWQHKTDTPIGELTLEDRKEGLWCVGRLLMALPEAQKAYLLIKARIVKGLSIGFDTVKDAVENGVRKLLELKLYEGSVVTFPMNEAALIASVKAAAARARKGDFNEELNEIQLGDAGYQMRYALSQALCSVTWSDLTREEKITASETVIQQFSDAYMAYYPAYLDMLASEYGDMEMWARKRGETKAGRRNSAADIAVLQAVIAQLQALLDDEAAEPPEGDDTSSKGAAIPPQSAEPAYDHSALQQFHNEMKGLVTWEN